MVDCRYRETLSTKGNLMLNANFCDNLNVRESLTLSHDELRTLFRLAACARNSDKWFSYSPKNRRDAIKICNTQCTVRTLCYRYALSQPYPILAHGVWAGMESEDIQAVYREKNGDTECHS